MRLFKRRTNIHVVPDGKDYWVVATEAAGDCGKFFRKTDAMMAARCVAIATQPSEVFEHNVLGEIVDRSTYPRSSDPPGRG